MIGKKVLAVIPARSGSKGLPGKNLAQIEGRSLTEIAVDVARQSVHVSHICVSTDSLEIRERVEKTGLSVPWLRDVSLATDDASSVDTVLDALARETEIFGTFDLVVLVEPTAPLRRSTDIDRAVETVLNNVSEVDACITVTQANFHPSAIQRIDSESGYLAPYSRDFERIESRRQDGLPAYLPIGNCFVIKVDTLLAERSFYVRKCVPLVLERYQSIEVDDEFDFDLASYLWAKQAFGP